jgi:hypothetical protein
MDLSPILVVRGTQCARKQHIRGCGPVLQRLPEQVGQRGQRGHVDKRRHNHARLLRIGRPFEHPGRNLQPAIRSRPAQCAAKRHAIGLRDCLVDRHPHPKPRMPGIQKCSKHRPVGVLKPCSTTPYAHTPPWVIGHRRRRSVCQLCRCRPAAQVRPGHIPRRLSCCTNILPGLPNGGLSHPPAVLSYRRFR